MKISLKSIGIIITILICIIIGLIFIIAEQKSNMHDINNLSKEDANTYKDSNQILKEFEYVSKSEIEHNDENIYKETNQELKEENEITQEEPEKIYTSYTKEFCDIDEENEDYFVYRENGEYFGWEESMWSGCSSWCSVKIFDVKVSASSTLKPHGIYSYDASNINNFSRLNAWVEGASDDGIGEFVEITQTCLINSENYKTDIEFEEICLVNGYAATEKNWIENNRIKELKMYFNDKYVTTIVLQDTIKQQYINISEFNLNVPNGEDAKFKFEIADVYKGTKYEDTCITGLLLEFSGRTGH